MYTHMKTSALFIITALMTSQLHGATAEESAPILSQYMPSMNKDPDNNVYLAMQACNEILADILGVSPAEYNPATPVSVDDLPICKEQKNEYKVVLSMREEWGPCNWKRIKIRLCNLGGFYYYGKINTDHDLKLVDTDKFPRDRTKAFKFFWFAANLEYRYAQYQLGVMLERGDSVPTKDPFAAYTWYRLAAAQDHPKAKDAVTDYESADRQCYIGQGYYHAKYGSKNPQAACVWLTRAAGQGHRDAMYSLGCIRREMGEAAASENWFEKAADKGHLDAMYNLARLLIDRGKAAASVPWFQKASDLGHVQATNSLGLSYIQGRGVPQDIPKGFALCLKAAEAGLSYADFSIGSFHEEGRGVPVDKEQARVWYAKAAAKGFEPAREALARLGAPMAGGAASTAAPTPPPPTAAEAPAGRA